MKTMRFLCLLVFTSCVIEHTSSTISISTSAQRFSISIDNEVIFKHTKDEPMIFLGRGSTNFEEFSGNFFVDDYITEKVGLPDYQFEALHLPNGTYRFVLSRGPDSVSLVFTEFYYQTSPRVSLDIEILPGGTPWDRVWLRLVAESDEKVYGGGEQFSYFNLRHRDGRPSGGGSNRQNVFPIWTSEQGVGRNKSTQVTFLADNLGRGGGDYFTTYFPQPTFVSSRKYYFHHTGTNYAVLDFSSDSFHEVAIHGKPDTIFMSRSYSMMDVVRRLQLQQFGRMQQLPDWIQEGAILAMQGGTDTMMARYQFAKENNIPVAGLWIQDWSGEQLTSFGKRVNWNWQWDPSFYPGLDDVIKNLTSEGVRVLGYINPNLDSRGSLYKEAASKGYLVKNSTGGVYLMSSITFNFGSVDFTNPQAFDWYKEVIKNNMIKLGLGGWMADFGEYLPVDAVMANGKTGLEVHNEYPVLWAMCNKMALQETGKLQEIVYFTRAGFSGISNATTMMWAGDQNVDFSLADGVRSAVYGALSMAMSGSGLTHFDIGGYTTYGTYGLKRTDEVLIRSAELAVFGPVFRAHEGNQPQFNSQWYSNSTVKAFSRLANAFAMLKDYRKYVTLQTVYNFEPTLRPFVLQYEDSVAPDTQFFFGPDLFVAPVYQSNVDHLMVVLPTTSGFKWVHVWSGQEYDGEHTQKIMTPLGFPAAFYRSDSYFKTDFEKLETLNTYSHQFQVIG